MDNIEEVIEQAGLKWLATETDLSKEQFIAQALLSSGYVHKDSVVRVKPLEWERLGGGVISASTGFGEYSVQKLPGHEFEFAAFAMDEDIGEFEREADAFAACESDCQQRASAIYEVGTETESSDTAPCPLCEQPVKMADASDFRERAGMLDGPRFGVPAPTTSPELEEAAYQALTTLSGIDGYEGVEEAKQALRSALSRVQSGRDDEYVPGIPDVQHLLGPIAATASEMEGMLLRWREDLRSAPPRVQSGRDDGDWRIDPISGGEVIAGYAVISPWGRTVGITDSRHDAEIVLEASRDALRSNKSGG